MGSRNVPFLGLAASPWESRGCFWTFAPIRAPRGVSVFKGSPRGEHLTAALFSVILEAPLQFLVRFQRHLLPFTFSFDFSFIFRLYLLLFRFYFLLFRRFRSKLIN